MSEIGISNEKFKEICREAIPAIKKLQEIAKKNDIKDSIRIYISEKGYFSMEGLGLEGWELYNYDDEATIKYAYREVLELKEEDKL